jgi:hypothetical protein
MRITAIIVNLIQMGMILTIFIMQGATMGGYAIMVSFLLILFAFINLLVLLFYTTNVATNAPLFGEEKPGIIKRQDIRVSYLSGPRPAALIACDRKIPILDLAENGARFLLPQGFKFKKRVQGEIALLCGQTIKVKGHMARREGDEVSLVFKTPLSQEILLLERQTIQGE